MENPPQELTIQPLEARHILNLFGRDEPDLVCPPRGFIAALLNAMVRADADNLDLLGTVYPTYVAAYRMAAFRTDGIDRLRKIARGA